MPDLERMTSVEDTGSFTNMRSLMTALARAMNLVNPDVEHHHEQTAYLALFIAREMHLACVVVC